MSIPAIRPPVVTRTPYVGEVSVSLDEFKPEEIAEYLRGLGYQVDGTFSRSVLQALEEKKRDRRRVNVYGDDDDDEDPEYEEGFFIMKSELSRIETLALCGQRDAAREAVLQLVSTEIGRAL